MGDRGNIAIRFHNGQEVFLYAHWSGHALPAVTRDALARKERWTDADYLARIVFCTLVEGSEKESTGFGISVAPAGDGEHPIIVLDVERQTVAMRPVDGGQNAAVIKSWTFEQFAALTDAECEDLGGLRRNGERYR